jgi:hypothetical protein
VKTTIIIEDSARTVSGQEASQPAADQRASTALGDAIDAGAAPDAAGPNGSASGRAGGYDAGMPPAWLADAINAAGGMTAPSLSQGIHQRGNGTAIDAGAARAD